MIQISVFFIRFIALNFAGWIPLFTMKGVDDNYIDDYGLLCLLPSRRLQVNNMFVLSDLIAYMSPLSSGRLLHFSFHFWPKHHFQ